MQPLHITYAGKARMLGLVALLLLFAALCAWIMCSSDSAIHLIVGLLGVLFSGGGAIVLLFLLPRAGKDMYVLDEQGVHFADTRYKMIPWSVVEGIVPFSIHSQHFVGLVLRDEEERVAALPRALRLVVQGNLAMGVPAFNLVLQNKKIQQQCMEHCMRRLEQEALREDVA